MLRNPNLTVYGIEYPDNIYEVETRKITPQSDVLATVEIYLACYSDEVKTYKFEHKPMYYVLKNLPNDPAQLNPALYLSELQIQHATEILDGTELQNFVVVP